MTEENDKVFKGKVMATLARIEQDVRETNKAFMEHKNFCQNHCLREEHRLTSLEGFKKEHEKSRSARISVVAAVASVLAAIGTIVIVFL